MNVWSNGLFKLPPIECRKQYNILTSFWLWKKYNIVDPDMYVYRQLWLSCVILYSLTAFLLIYFIQAKQGIELGPVRIPDATQLAALKENNRYFNNFYIFYMKLYLLWTANIAVFVLTPFFIMKISLNTREGFNFLRNSPLYATEALRSNRKTHYLVVSVLGFFLIYICIYKCYLAFAYLAQHMSDDQKLIFVFPFLVFVIWFVPNMICCLAREIICLPTFLKTMLVKDVRENDL
jgi:hypothetical protein